MAAQESSQKALNEQLTIMREMNMIDILSKYIEISDGDHKIAAQKIVAEITENIFLTPKFQHHLTPTLEIARGDHQTYLILQGTKPETSGYTILTIDNKNDGNFTTGLAIRLFCRNSGIKNLRYKGNKSVSFDKTTVIPHKISAYNEYHILMEIRDIEAQSAATISIICEGIISNWTWSQELTISMVMEQYQLALSASERIEIID